MLRGDSVGARCEGPVHTWGLPTPADSTLGITVLPRVVINKFEALTYPSCPGAPAPQVVPGPAAVAAEPRAGGQMSVP